MSENHGADVGESTRGCFEKSNSFLDFVRKNNPSEQAAFIEHIFPQKKTLHYGRIIRLLSPEAYPISEKLAAKILIELARRCRNGHPVARHTALETLALSWLCIACSRIRLPKTLETVRGIQPEAFFTVHIAFFAILNRGNLDFKSWNTQEAEDRAQETKKDSPRTVQHR